MAAIELVLVPVPAKPGRYAAHLPGCVLVHSSRQPLLDGARVLLAKGVPPETALTTRHQGSDIVAQRSTVGEAARSTITERDRGGMSKIPWTPWTSGHEVEGS